MRRQVKLRLVLLLVTMPWSAGVLAQGRVYEIYTNELTCDYCAWDLEQAFRKIPGVTDFDVDIDGILFVHAEETLVLDETRVRKMLIDNGFDYRGMKETQSE